MAKERVRRAAKRFGLSASEIVRQAVDYQLPRWEAGRQIIINAKEDE
jgi:hypothetical protein